MDKCDLFSEETRNALTKFKIYEAKDEALKNTPNLIQKIKSTARIATDKDFKVKI